MILLPYANQVLRDTVLSKLEAEKREVCDHKLCDFDNVSFSVTISPDDTETINVGMNAPFWHEISDKGAQDGVEEFYHKYISSGDNNVNLAVPAADFKDGAEEFADAVANMKSNVIGGIFRRYFDGMRNNSPLTDFLEVHLRSDTTMYLVPKSDRLVVVFAMEFPNKTDRVIANVLLGEMEAAKRKVGGAPICNFSTKVPREVQECGVSPDAKADSGYVSFAVLRRHIDTKEKAQKASEIILGFRQYLTYHIKCSKAFFHQRMRAQVTSLLQILNRAKTDKEKKKKLYSGKIWKPGM